MVRVFYALLDVDSSLLGVSVTSRVRDPRLSVPVAEFSYCGVFVAPYTTALDAHDPVLCSQPAIDHLIETAFVAAPPNRCLVSGADSFSHGATGVVFAQAHWSPSLFLDTGLGGTHRRCSRR